jgi:hypothetical protein
MRRNDGDELKEPKKIEIGLCFFDYPAVYW